MSSPTRRLPGAGSVSPAEPGAGSAPSAAPPSAPVTVDVLARFVTAAGALAFAEEAMQAALAEDVPCFRDDAGRYWWIRVRYTLGPLREMAGLSAAALYVRTPAGYIMDRGWGDDPGPGPVAKLPPLTEVTLLDLVRTAGLHQAPAGLPGTACVLLPGHLVPALLARALDLRLAATYQQARLDPLFGPGAAPRFCYAVRLAVATAPAGATLPAPFVAALRDDPFALVCRVVDDTLLIAHGTASPLSDRTLARMAATAADGTWLLAPAPDGCARVTWIGEPRAATGLVRLGPAHALADVDGTQAYAGPGDQALPEPRPLRLVPVTGRGSGRVDAVLLDDADLACLPPLLAGEPLADVAYLVRGTRRHLLSAPGGLLTELAVGEPLTCVGPGPVYLPAEYRIDPPLGPRARAALFEPDDAVAQVMLRDARLRYDLDAAEPVWRLWAGPLPDVDPQLADSALADLQDAALELDGAKQPGQAAERPSPARLFGRRPGAAEEPSTWRDQAFQAERERDYVTAAQLYARHNEPLRAARMWEREAEERY